MDHYMIRQELNPETCRLDTNNEINDASYEEMKQVRGVDQTPYPSQLHGASLATAMQRPCRPCIEIS